MSKFNSCAAKSAQRFKDAEVFLPTDNDTAHPVVLSRGADSGIVNVVSFAQMGWDAMSSFLCWNYRGAGVEWETVDTDGWALKTSEDAAELFGLRDEDYNGESVVTDEVLVTDNGKRLVLDDNYHGDSTLLGLVNYCDGQGRWVAEWLVIPRDIAGWVSSLM